LDVKKRKYAVDGNLNYLEIFSLKIDECIKEFENYVQNINKN
jgi:hypothetical protein